MSYLKYVNSCTIFVRIFDKPNLITKRFIYLFFYVLYNLKMTNFLKNIKSDSKWPLITEG